LACYRNKELKGFKETGAISLQKKERYMTDNIVKIGDDFKHENPSMSYRKIKVITEVFKAQISVHIRKECLWEIKTKCRPDVQNILNGCSNQLGLVKN